MGLIGSRLPMPVHDTRVHMTPTHFNPQVQITWRLNPNGSRYGFSMSTKPMGSGTGNPRVYSCSALLVGMGIHSMGTHLIKPQSISIWVSHCGYLLSMDKTHRYPGSHQSSGTCEIQLTVMSF